METTYTDSGSALPPAPPAKGGEYELANKAKLAASTASDEEEADMTDDDEEVELSARPHSGAMDKIFDLKRLSIVGEDIKRGNIWKLCYDITC